MTTVRAVALVALLHVLPSCRLPDADSNVRRALTAYYQRVKGIA